MWQLWQVHTQQLNLIFVKKKENKLELIFWRGFKISD